MVVFCLVWLLCFGGIDEGGVLSVGYTSSGGVFPLGWVFEKGGAHQVIHTQTQTDPCASKLPNARKHVQLCHSNHLGLVK